MSEIEERLIDIKCDTCGKTHQVTRTLDIPENIDRLECNWCAECEDKATEPWTERWVRAYRHKNNMRHRFGMQLTINGKETRRYNEVIEESPTIIKFKGWIGYWRQKENDDGTFTYRYVDECVCENRTSGNYGKSGDPLYLCIRCGDAIPSPKEEKKLKEYYGEKDS